MRLSLISLLCIPIVIPANADLSDMREWDNLGEDEKTDEAIAIRCAGLIQSMLVFADNESVSAQTVEAFQKGVELFSGLAVILRGVEDPGLTPAQIDDEIKGDVDNVADQYIARMEGNVRDSGEAFGSDELILFDFGLCRSILEKMGSPQ